MHSSEQWVLFGSPFRTPCTLDKLYILGLFSCSYCRPFIQSIRFSLAGLLDTLPLLLMNSPEHGSLWLAFLGHLSLRQSCAYGTPCAAMTDIHKTARVLHSCRLINSKW
ncbi:hypothetical protein AVEN_149388-1 [Araneus ventricosus]|uniref:Uncharacterized protein n=1 Tax=Araneus ventricosus TaxID=182803 RepID=A0A4Y2SI57_ARAVE|nr:hypothetical protein AVEN_149388-1 [Araneus ventricosus]